LRTFEWLRISQRLRTGLLAIGLTLSAALPGSAGTKTPDVLPGSAATTTPDIPPGSAAATTPDIPPGSATIKTPDMTPSGALPGSAATQPPNILPRSSVATTTPDIRGIYVIGQKFFLSNGQLAQAIATPGVDGILVDLDWSDLASPTLKRTYSWTLLDSMVQLAVSQGKKFEIAIITGGSTPAWVFPAQPQGKIDSQDELRATSGKFEYLQANKPGATCIDETLAPPWDSFYLAALSDLLVQLSAHLKAQGTYRSLTMLRLTGINTLTDELRLPAQTPIDTPIACMIDNLKVWQALGYTQGMLATAWRRMLTLSTQAFPDKFFNVALITTNGLPAFLPSGTPVYTPASQVQQLSDDMLSMLINIAGQKLPGKLVVQANGLVGSGPPDPITIAKAQAAQALLAWQTNEWELQTGGAACGGIREAPVACDEAGFSAMLMTGVYPQSSSGTNPLKAQYLELFAPNISAFPDVVLQVHDVLLQ
jgi:hypothetical protein